MRAYFINSETDEHKEIDIEPSLEEYYRLLGCDCIDIIVREVNSTPFNIVLDDEGLLKPNRITGMSLSADERLAGSLLIFGVEEGTCELRGLTNKEVLVIQRRMVDAMFSDGSEHPTFWYSR